MQYLNLLLTNFFFENHSILMRSWKKRPLARYDDDCRSMMIADRRGIPVLVKSMNNSLTTAQQTTNMISLCGVFDCVMFVPSIVLSFSFVSCDSRFVVTLCGGCCQLLLCLDSFYLACCLALNVCGCSIFVYLNSALSLHIFRGGSNHV